MSYLFDMNSSPAHNQPEREQAPAIAYLNPIPVVVAIVPVIATNPATGAQEVGLLTIERGFPPQQGHLALPGGYLEYEDWRVGVLRELAEETGVALSNIDEVTLQGVHSIDQNRKLVIFGKVPPIRETLLRSFSPSEECPRYEILFEARELAFSTHSEIARRFFAPRPTQIPADLNSLALPSLPHP
jgi:ADP-ribose pyrophosphatase YjhB (NUDIX family)